MSEAVVETRPAETFVASRWTSGNRLFPTQIVVSPEHVLRIKRRFFGSDQESIAMRKVASVRITTGLIWSAVAVQRGKPLGSVARAGVLVWSSATMKVARTRARARGVEVIFVSRLAQGHG